MKYAFLSKNNLRSLVFLSSLLFFHPAWSQKADTAPSSKLVDKIVVIVNNEIITTSDIASYKNNLKSKSIQSDLFEVDPKELIKDEQKLIAQMIDEKLLDSEVKKQNLSISFEQVEEEVRNIQRREGLSRQQLIDSLKKSGVAFSDYQDFVKKSIERHSLVGKSIRSKIKISDEDIASYYISNTKNAAKDAYEFNVSQIVFYPKDSDWSGAEERANKVYKLLQSGQSFAALANKFSEDSDFSKDGVLGTFKTGELAPFVDAAIQSLKSSEYSSVIKGPNAYYIFFINKKNIIMNPEILAQKDRIMQVLMQEAFKKQFRFWLDQKRREAYIKHI